MKNKNIELAEQSIPDKWISWLFGHNVLFTYQERFTVHLCSLCFLACQLRAQPLDCSEVLRAGQTRGCRQRGERWQFCSFPRWSVCDRYTSLTNTAVGFYRIQMRSTSSSRDQLYNHEYLRELAFLSPSLENYCFCCFSKTTNWLCLPLLLLSMSILPCAKWWIYILVLLTDFKSKHLHLGKN